MHAQNLLVVLLSATAAGAPTHKNIRQDSSGLGGLLSGLGGASSTGSGSSAIPTGLLGGLGSLTGSGSSAIPTGLLGGLGSGSSTGSGSSALPTGLLGGLKDKKRQSLSSLSGILGSLTGSSTSSSPSSSSLSSLGSLTSLASDSSSDTENGLSGDCMAVTVIFARGTTEPGNVGIIVGPDLTSDLQSQLGSAKVAVQGVDYAASADGIASEVPSTGGAGTKAMVADVNEALSKCPDTQIVLSGYSQGAMLVHNTMNNLNTTAAGSIKAAVTFGDPFVGTEPKNIPDGSFKSFCASGDEVCSTEASSSPSSGGTTSASKEGHLGYGSDTGTAATFIKGKVTV